MSKERITIFDIPHLVDSICHDFSSDDFVNCKKVCKAWNATFAPYEWLSVWLYKHQDNPSVPCIPLPAMKHQTIRDHSQWIWTLEIGLFDTFLQGSDCTNLLELVCIYGEGPQTGASEEESSLALLSQNSRLRTLELDYYDNHVRSHMLPNLPRLTHLQWLKLRLNDTWMSDFDLFLDMLQCLPSSLQGLDLQVLHWKQDTFSETPTTPQRTWKPTAIRQFKLYPTSCGGERYFLIPFLDACPLLERLSVPAIPSRYAEELMGTLASSCPNLSCLELNPRRLKMTPVGTECLYFAQMYQSLSALTLDISSDTENVVVPTLLARSATTLRDLSLINAYWVPSLDLAMILRTCPKLGAFHVNGLVPAGRLRSSITLQDLVKVPWICDDLVFVHFNVTDARDTTGMAEDEDEGDERKETALLLLQLYQQMQSLKRFSRHSLFLLRGKRFDAMPKHNTLRYMCGQLTDNDLSQLRAIARGEGL